jgi:pyruvate/2-oxoglutarate dehydrogenase complex dihydrolipoamide dehydrogenase (E3) component
MNDHANTEYDVIVLGGGTAGSNAARAAAREGAKTAMIHLPQWWNLCIQRGCMPSKSMLAASEAAHETQHTERYGVSVDGTITPDYQAILKRKDDHVARFADALYESFSDEAFEIIVGRAHFLPDGETLHVDTDDGELTVSAKRYVIATGSTAFVPPIEGIEQVPYVTSDAVMKNEVQSVPDKLAVVGGGPIGLEMGTFFASLGSEVLIIDRNPLVAQYGADFSDSLATMLRDAYGMQLYAPASLDRFSSNEQSTVCHITKDGEEHTEHVDLVLVATGRRPNTDSLLLEHVGLEETADSLAQDTSTQTNDERIYAAGDVTSEMQILHVAAEEGTVAGYNAAYGDPQRHVHYESLQFGMIFTDPPIAHFGPFAEELAERSNTISADVEIPSTGRAITMGVTHGRFRLYADRSTGEIIAATCFGPRADDLIHELYFAKRLGATVQQLADMLAYHPTLSEQVVKLAQRCRAQMNDS